MSVSKFPREKNESGANRFEDFPKEKNEGRANRFGDGDFPYADIVDKSRPISKTHPPMSSHDRAAQFSAFAALTGHSDAISKTADMVEEKVAFEVEREMMEDS